MNLDTFRIQFFASAPRYEWLELLGRGGMGVVFKARDLVLDEIVAIKILYGHVADDDGAVVARFKREISLNRKVKHPNVARMYDFGTSDGHPYITMEFIPGKDLQTLILEEGRIAPSRALPILRQICLGTQSAHEQGIVHRDLKSQNIIVGEGDRVSILDFGLARGLVDDKLTLDAVVLGTPHYISPEQAMGQPADARSDIYSLGIIAFEMLAGVLPFTADSALGIAMKQISEAVPGNLSLYPDVSPRLSEAVHRALEKRREDRFQSASELEAAFARAAEEKFAPAAALGGDAKSRAIDEVLADLDAAARSRRAAAGADVDTRTPLVQRHMQSGPASPAPPVDAAHAAHAPQAPPSPAPVSRPETVAPPTVPSARFSLPQRSVPPPPAPAPAVAPAPPRPTGRPTVFLVLADGAERISMGKALADSGCIAVEARSGEEVLDLLMSRMPDAVVMDVVLPKADGFEVARILKATPIFARVPVLLLGTRVDRSQENFARQVGASDILARPVAERDLVARTWRLLGPLGFYRDEVQSARVTRPGSGRP
ncbi:MAG TPA: serine/threonine-protein kinase [Thermoanaerobaculia bacterium]|nr:serine/threonine-protein kinase [Thermoanaerobaculia bacterium]